MNTPRRRAVRTAKTIWTPAAATRLSEDTVQVTARAKRKPD
jgi:hypothetical protein